MAATKSQPFDRYGLSWMPSASDLDIEFEIISQTDEWRKANGLTLFDHYKAAQQLLWPQDDHHRWSDLGLRAIVENEVAVFMGSSDCVAGDTRILNPITGEHPTIRSLCESGKRPTVMTLNGPQLAGVPFLKGEDDLFEVVCENGNRFTATANHVVLTSSGYRFLCSLQVQDVLLGYGACRPQSISEHVLSTRKPDDARCYQTPQGSQGGYPMDSCSYGERLHPYAGNVPTASQQQVDAPKRKSRVVFSFEDGLENTRRYIRLCQSFDRHAIWRSFDQKRILEKIGQLSRVVKKNALDAQKFQSFGQSHSGCIPADSFSEPIPDCDSRRHAYNSCHPSAWPYVIVPTRVLSIEKVGRGEFFDLTVPDDHHYFAEGTIHHNSGKTRTMAKFVLMDWWARPDKCLWLVSSTELRGAELRIWGVLKEMFNAARALHPQLPGTVLESAHAITTEAPSTDNSEGRLLTKGLVFVPTKVGGKWVGLGSMIGVKPMPGGRLGHCGDETQSMQPVLLDAYSNFYGKEGFKGIMAGNPFDTDDTICRAAEPVEGWDAWHDTGKTQTWRSKFYNALVVSFDGRDSPNFDYPPDQPTRYKYLIGRKKIEAVGRTHGKDSWQWFMQCVGKPRPGAVARRVVTRAMCETYHAFSEVTWMGTPTVKIGFCDAAYGGMGGDRCMAGYLEFGKDITGHTVIACHPLVLVPVKMNRFVLPEDQIANFVRDYMQSVNVEPQNFFFDGRGSLAVALSRLWSPKVEAVEFGGRATERPVSNDTFMWDGDRKTRRLQRCDELYSKFVTELWFGAHMVIISDQMRQLPQDVAAELCRREWDYVQNAKIEIETKEDMKLRTGESPDLADALVTGLEGARRRGFQIARLPGKGDEEHDDGWKLDLRLRAMNLKKSYSLTYN